MTVMRRSARGHVCLAVSGLSRAPHATAPRNTNSMTSTTYFETRGKTWCPTSNNGTESGSWTCVAVTAVTSTLATAPSGQPQPQVHSYALLLYGPQHGHGGTGRGRWDTILSELSPCDVGDQPEFNKFTLTCREMTTATTGKLPTTLPHANHNA